jgi:hypothetical protein
MEPNQNCNTYQLRGAIGGVFKKEREPESAVNCRQKEVPLDDGNPD